MRIHVLKILDAASEWKGARFSHSRLSEMEVTAKLKCAWGIPETQT